LSFYTKPLEFSKFQSSPGFEYKLEFCWYFTSRPLIFSQITITPIYFFTNILPTFCIYKYTPRTFPKFQFSHCNFKPSYLSNRYIESGDSCAKILRITSSFSTSYSYIYHYWICLIVCLCIMRNHSGATTQENSATMCNTPCYG
jgi:hypothetical protein